MRLKWPPFCNFRGALFQERGKGNDDDVNDVRKRMTDTCIHQLKSSFPLLSHFPTSENMSYITLFWITGVFTAAFDSGIEWLIVKGIADYAVSCSAQQNAKSWRRCACVMAASLVMHILRNPTVFRSWPHYKGNFDKTLILFCWLVSILLRFLSISTSKML